MTMLDKFKPKPPHDGQTRMPRGPNLAPQSEPLPVPLRPNHFDEYADEAKRAAQRYLDQVSQIEVLKEDADAWRHRCMARDAQIEQLKTDLAALAADLDHHKETLTVIRTQYQTASKILLDGFAAIDRLGAPVQGPGDPVPLVNMQALSAAISEFGDPVDAVPAEPKTQDELDDRDNRLIDEKIAARNEHSRANK